MFEIHDDIEVLKRMGMACGLEVGKCSPENLKIARSLVPKALEPYVIGKYFKIRLRRGRFEIVPCRNDTWKNKIDMENCFWMFFFHTR